MKTKSTVSRSTVVQLSRATAKMLDAGYALSRVYDDNIPEVRDAVASAIEHASDHIRGFAEVIRNGNNFDGYDRPVRDHRYHKPIAE